MNETGLFSCNSKLLPYSLCFRLQIQTAENKVYEMMYTQWLRGVRKVLSISPLYIAFSWHFKYILIIWHPDIQFEVFQWAKIERKLCYFEQNFYYWLFKLLKMAFFDWVLLKSTYWHADNTKTWFLAQN